VSLIDEALKRAQEAHDREADGARRRPWAPAPMPDAGRARRKRFRFLAALAAVVALAAAGLLLWRRSAATSPAPPASRGAVLPTAGPPTPAPLEEVQVAPPPRGVGAAPGPRPSAAEGKRPVPQAAAPAAPSGAPPAPPTFPPSDRGGPASGRTYTGPVALPGGGRLELEGIVYSEANATAVINGRILGEGASVEGFTVTRIEESRVTLSGNGLTFTLAVR